MCNLAPKVQYVICRTEDLASNGCVNIQVLSLTTCLLGGKTSVDVSLCWYQMVGSNFEFSSRHYSACSRETGQE